MAEEPLYELTNVADVEMSVAGGSLEESLSKKEALFLNAAQYGKTDIVEKCLEDRALNPNCIDYMGRCALELAIDSDNLETIDVLLTRLKFAQIEDGLLHAIQSEKIDIVKLIISCPSYKKFEHMRPEMTEERSQYPPDITPLILAAHLNNHEVIQIFLNRGHSINWPHKIGCGCADCVTGRKYDSLLFEKSRLHKYKALAGPAYMALASSDPIQMTFELRQRLIKLADKKKEFKNDYDELGEQCLEFADSILNLCRSSGEIQALLASPDDESGQIDSIGTLKQAVQQGEKKFVTHPNSQHQLSKLFYGNTQFIHDMGIIKVALFYVLIILGLPFAAIGTAICPRAKCFQLYRTPAVKFFNHTICYFVFLFLIMLQTFYKPEDDAEKQDHATHYDKIVANLINLSEYLFRMGITKRSLEKQPVYLLIYIWIIGNLIAEIKQVYESGIREYLKSTYNILDSIALSLYLSSLSLKIVLKLQKGVAEAAFRGRIEKVINVMYDAFFNPSLGPEAMSTFQNVSLNVFNDPLGYYLRGPNIWLDTFDPEIVGDCLFAIANILSFARTTYLMPVIEALGPMQISLGRMMSDIAKFLFIFVLVAISFVVGLRNLYHNYARILTSVDFKSAHLTYSSGVKGFFSPVESVKTLFWDLFGMVDTDVTEVDTETELPNNDLFFNDNNLFLTTHLGALLFGLYNVIMVIILLNMLIALMGDSFQKIQDDANVQWKFARTKLWMNYMGDDEIMPPPFNIIPTRDNFRDLYRFFKPQSGGRYKTNDDSSTASGLRKNLVRRYLHQLHRETRDDDDAVGGMAEDVGIERKTSQRGSTTRETRI